jgi:hypothetical protein
MTRSVWNQKRPGVSGTEKDQASLEPNKTIRVWNRKMVDQESLEPVDGRRRESGIGRGNTRSVWNCKKANQESLEPEDRKLGQYGTGREKTRRVWNRKRDN